MNPTAGCGGREGTAVTYGGLLTVMLLGMAVLGMAGLWAGTHALLHDRVPGRRFNRIVRNRRLWGAGLLVVLSSVLFLSWAPAVIGLVIMIAGHVIRPTG
ncbi:hypothetical protein [Streptomyces pseudogriseolus]|uniref:hypothetical protein n=2 Tax=Streptomyces pseudogriseolus TaxID=36817 RepID=UPI0036933C97